MEVCYSRLGGVNIIFETGSQVTKGEKSKISLSDEEALSLARELIRKVTSRRWNET